MSLSRLRTTLPPLDVEIANGRESSSPFSFASTVTPEPETAIFNPMFSSDHRNPFGAPRTPQAATPYPEQIVSPRDQSVYPTPDFTFPGTPQDSYTPTAYTPSTPRPGRKSRGSIGISLNQEQRDLALYLVLQGIHIEAIGVELCRLQVHFGANTSIDKKGKVMGSYVVAAVKEEGHILLGRAAHADQVVSHLIARAEREGWSEGPLSRAREYSNSLERGSSISSDSKNRQYEARCRAAFQKWRIKNKDRPPKEDGKTKDEKMAYQGWISSELRENADEPDREEMETNLVSLWVDGTIAGKALKP